MSAEVELCADAAALAAAGVVDNNRFRYPQPALVRCCERGLRLDPPDRVQLIKDIIALALKLTRINGAATEPARVQLVALATVLGATAQELAGFTDHVDRATLERTRASLTGAMPAAKPLVGGLAAPHSAKLPK